MHTANCIAKLLSVSLWHDYCIIFQHWNNIAVYEKTHAKRLVNDITYIRVYVYVISSKENTLYRQRCVREITKNKATKYWTKTIRSKYVICSSNSNNKKSSIV